MEISKLELGILYHELIEGERDRPCQWTGQCPGKYKHSKRSEMPFFLQLAKFLEDIRHKPLALGDKDDVIWSCKFLAQEHLLGVSQQ